MEKFGEDHLRDRKLLRQVPVELDFNHVYIVFRGSLVKSIRFHG